MTDVVAIELGRRIKEQREAAGLTQAELATLTLKSVETISNFERGKTLPGVRTLVALADHMGCAPADFFKPFPVKPATIDPVANKARLLSDRDRALLEGIVDLLLQKSRRE